MDVPVMSNESPTWSPLRRVALGRGHALALAPCLMREVLNVRVSCGTGRLATALQCAPRLLASVRRPPDEPARCEMVCRRHSGRRAGNSIISSRAGQRLLYVPDAARSTCSRDRPSLHALGIALRPFASGTGLRRTTDRHAVAAACRTEGLACAIFDAIK